jgi:hypothetical protein
VRAGDLVWHIEDLKDNMNIPGLIMSIRDGEAIVRFTDRTFDEYHDTNDLTLDTFLYADENVMGNP